MAITYPAESYRPSSSCLKAKFFRNFSALINRWLDIMCCAHQNFFLSLSRLSRPHSTLPMTPDKPYKANDQASADHSIEAMEVFAQRIPVLAQLHADIGKSEAPGP